MPTGGTILRESTNRNATTPGGFSISNVLPGLPGLTASAMNIIKGNLEGLPSPSEARLQNAYFGAGSGLDPTSEFLTRRGYDLYKRQANQRQQQGLSGLLGLIQTYSGAVAPTPGQELQNQLGQQEIAQRGGEFGQNYAFEQQQWQKQLELLNRFLGGG